MLVLTVNMIQPGVTWLDITSTGLFRSDWSVAMSVSWLMIDRQGPS